MGVQHDHEPHANRTDEDGHADDNEPSATDVHQQRVRQAIMAKRRSGGKTKQAGKSAPTAAHAATVPATTGAAKAQGAGSPVDAIHRANDEIEVGLLPAWQRSMDALDLAGLAAVAQRAVQSANETDRLINDSAGATDIEMAAAENRQLWSGLGTLRYQGEPIAGPRARVGASTADFVHERYELGARCIDVTQQVLAICARRKEDENGRPELDSADAMAIARILTLHGEASEQGFLWKALRLHGHERMVRHLGGFAGAMVQEASNRRTDEAAATHGWTEEAIGPERIEFLHSQVNDVADAVDRRSESGMFYVMAIKQFAEPERGAFVRMLQTRGLLFNMVRLGGDDVKFVIRRSGGFTSWRYDEGRADVEPKKSALGAVKAAAKSIPGATANFAAGVYSGLGHVPVVGGVFKRSAESFRELGEYADDEIGVPEEDRGLRNKIAGTAGAIDSMILQAGVAAEVGAGQAATAFNAARGANAAYEGYTTVQKITGMLGELQDGWATAKNGWALWTNTMNEMSGMVTDVLIDQATGDPKQTVHIIDHVSALFDMGIEQLGGKVAGRTTEAGKKKEAKRATHDADRDKGRGEVAQRTASADLKIEVSLLGDAHKRLENAVDPAERAAIEQEMEHHAERVRVLSTPEHFGNAALVEARIRDEKEEAEEAQQEKDDAKNEHKFRDGVKKLGHSIAEKIKEALIEFGIAALSSAKDQLVNQLKARLTSGKPLDIAARKILANAVAKGASKVAVDMAGEFVRDAIGDLIHKGIEKLIAAHFPGMEGMATLLDGPIGELLEHLEEQLGVDSYIEEPIEELILRMFGEEKAEDEAG